MKSNHLKTLVCASFLGLSAMTLAANAPRIIVADAVEVLNRYEKAQESQRNFEQSREEAQKEDDKMTAKMDELKKELGDLEQKMNSPTLTEEAKAKIQNTGMDKLKELEKLAIEQNQYRQQTAQTLSQRSQSVMKVHVEEVDREIEKIAKEKSADLMLNSSGRFVLYADKSQDVTEELVSRLNSGSKSAIKSTSTKKNRKS